MEKELRELQQVIRDVKEILRSMTTDRRYRSVPETARLFGRVANKSKLYKWANEGRTINGRAIFVTSSAGKAHVHYKVDTVALAEWIALGGESYDELQSVKS